MQTSQLPLPPSSSPEPSSTTSSNPPPSSFPNLRSPSPRDSTATTSTADGNEDEGGEGTKKKRNPLVDLLESEKRYVEELGAVIRKVAGAWSRQNFPPPLLDTMFRSIEGIYKVNRAFGNKLKDLGPNPHSRVLGDVLMRWIDDLLPSYTRYSTTFMTSFDSYPPILTNPNLPRILSEVNASLTPPPPNVDMSGSRGVWTLDGLFLLPYARLKYYKKLYSRLLKSTVPGRSDHTVLITANERLDALLDATKDRLSMTVDGEPKEDDGRLSMISSAAGSHASHISGASSLFSSPSARNSSTSASTSFNGPSTSTSGFVPSNSSSNNNLSPSSPPLSKKQQPTFPQHAPPALSSSAQFQPPVQPSPQQREDLPAPPPTSPEPPTREVSPLRDIEIRLDADRTLDLFTMNPRKVRLQISPPNLPFTRELRRSLSCEISFVPTSTNQLVRHREGQIFILSDLFLICERKKPDERPVGPEGKADLWLLYPPLAGKHLSVKPGRTDSFVEVVVMRKETFLLRVDGADTQRTLLDDFKTCIEFAANVNISVQTRSSPQPPSTLTSPTSASPSALMSPIGQLNSSPTPSFLPAPPPKTASPLAGAAPPPPSFAASTAAQGGRVAEVMRETSDRVISGGSEYSNGSSNGSGSGGGGGPKSRQVSGGPSPSMPPPSLSPQLQHPHPSNLQPGQRMPPTTGTDLQPGQRMQPMMGGGQPQLQRQPSGGPLPPRSQSVMSGELNYSSEAASPPQQQQQYPPFTQHVQQPSNDGPPAPAPNHPHPQYSSQPQYPPPRQQQQQQPHYQNGPGPNNPNFFPPTTGHDLPPPPPMRPLRNAQSNSNFQRNASNPIPNGSGSPSDLVAPQTIRSRSTEPPPSSPISLPSAAFLDNQRAHTSYSTPSSPNAAHQQPNGGGFAPSPSFHAVMGDLVDPSSPPSSPQDLTEFDHTAESLAGPAVITAQMKCKVFLKQSHAQWKNLGPARLKLYHHAPTNGKQLFVEKENTGLFGGGGEGAGKILISTLVLTDGVERVGKTGVAVELSDRGKRTGIIYMVQCRNEVSASGLMESLLAGTGRMKR